MVSWNDTWPDGSKSVKENEAPGKQNTAYIANKLGDQILGTNDGTAYDHFWDLGDYSGRHRFCQMPAFVGAGLNSDIPVFGSQMDGIFYVKTKTATESPAVQKPEPFHISKPDAVQNILQLGFRVICGFEGRNSAGTVAQASMLYTHNVKTSANIGIVRGASPGNYKINFINALPSDAYIVSGMAMRKDAGKTPLIVGIKSAAVRTDVMTTTSVEIIFKDNTDTGIDPLYAMITIVGG